MKLTRREVTLLFLLAVVALVYFGVMYLILPQYQTDTGKQSQLETLQGQLDTLSSNTSNLDTQLSQAKAKSQEISKPFSQSIDTEQLEYWVDTLLKQSGLNKVTTVYTNMTPANPDFIKDITDTNSAQETGITLQNTVDAANGVQTPAPSPSPSASPSPEPSPSASADAQNSALGAASPGQEQKKIGLNCEQLVLTASGNYDGIAKFMDALYANGRALTVDAFGITKNSTGGETIALTIRFYGVPLITGIAQGYDFPSPAGQSALMSTAPAPTPTPTPTPPVASPSATASASPAVPASAKK